VVELEVCHASLYLVLEEVAVVTEDNHKGLDAPTAGKEVVQSPHRWVCQSIPLGEVLPFFALEAQGNESKLKPCKM